MASSQASKLILAFVLLIVGVSLLVQIASSINTAVSTKYESETFNVAPARLAGGEINTTYKFYPTRATEAASGWRLDQGSPCSVDRVILGTFTNATGSAYTDPTHVVRNTAGYFTLTNTVAVNSSSNSTIGTFEYCPDDYLTQAWNRNLLVIIPGLFAIAILAVSVGLFYSIGKETGLID